MQPQASTPTTTHLSNKGTACFVRSLGPPLVPSPHVSSSRATSACTQSSTTTGHVRSSTLLTTCRSHVTSSGTAPLAVTSQGTYARSRRTSRTWRPARSLVGRTSTDPDPRKSYFVLYPMSLLLPVTPSYGVSYYSAASTRYESATPESVISRPHADGCTRANALTWHA